jgi:hypothetical protein
MRHTTARAFAAKVRKGIFRPVLRHLPEHVAEDRLQEGVCLTYEMYARYAERGVVLDDAVLVHSCRQRATDPGRRFVKHAGQPRRDALDPRHQLDGRLEVYCLDGLPLDSGEQPPSDHDRHLQELSQRAFQRDPTETIVSAISVRQWLSTLSPDDRTVVALRASGWTLAEIATALESSISRVFARLNELGRALALHADLPVPTRRCHG